jgi:predicted RNA methylase
MSVRATAKYPRMKNEAYYTPPAATAVLLDQLPLYRLMQHELWEPAAGAGHIARELGRVSSVLATDIAPPLRQVHTVLSMDFLESSGPSGRGPLSIITNPPYGFQNRLALTFLHHAMDLVERRQGLVAMLLPFEFDASRSRHELVGGHFAFVAKITVGERIRWLNLPQSRNPPMGHHSWFVWSFDRTIRRLMRRHGQLRTI